MTEKEWVQYFPRNDFRGIFFKAIAVRIILWYTVCEGVDTMSARETAYNIVDSLSEKQLEAFIALFGQFLEIPNEETRDALAEVEDIKKHPDKYKAYTDVDEMFKELLA